MNRQALLAACVALILVLSPRGEGADRVVIHLKWFHNAQSAGLYAAEQRGFFAREGIEVEFVNGPATEEVLIALSEGVYDFVVADPSRHLNLMSQEVPNVAVAVIFQIDPAVIFALEESGIRRPEDLVGKRVMFYPTSLIVPAVLGRVGLSLADIETGPVSYDLSDLYSGVYDAWSGYYTNEVRRAREDGYDVNVIYPTDYGVHLYGDVLIARRDLVETRPELVRGVVSALIEGWRWVLGHVEEAVGLALAWDPQLDPEEQHRILIACLPFIHAGEAPLGVMTDERWSNMVETMIGFGLLPADFDPTDAFTLDFVRAVYPSNP